MAIKSLMILLIVATLSRATKVFHVTPTLPAVCPCPPPCHTLDHYAQNPLLFAEYTNITVFFLRGKHNLTLNLIFNCSELTLQGQKKREHTESGIVINFKPKTRIYFEISNHFSISDITLRCRRNSEVTISTVYTALLHSFIFDGVNLVARQAHSIYINECTGSRSKLEFIDTVFININKTTISRIGNHSSEELGINISSISVSHLSIHESQITNFFIGVYTSGNQVKVLIESSRFDGNFYGVQLNKLQVTIINAVFENNRVGVYVSNDCLQKRITIKNTYFIRNKYGVFSNKSYSTNMWILNSTITKSRGIGLVLRSTTHVNLTTSYITENRLGIVSISSTVTIENTSFSDNTVGMLIPTANMFIPNATDGINSIRNCIFSLNSLAGMTLINSRGKTEIKDCGFYNNKGTPILAYRSMFKLMGKTVFRDNTADRGGGLALYNSTVRFGSGSNTQFMNNTALEYGGAIYITTLPSIPSTILRDFETIKDRETNRVLHENILLRQKCFYSITEKKDTHVNVDFRGNTAMLGGLSIFGPTLDTSKCSVTNEWFSYDESVPSFLHVSSNPSRVCFCVNGEPNYEMLMLNEERYPGEIFSVPVVLTGYKYGRVEGPVYTNVVGHKYEKVLDDNQYVQVVKLSCKKLNFTIIVIQNLTIFTLALTAYNQFTPDEASFIKNLRNIESFVGSRCENQQCITLHTTPIYINVTLEACPPGFKLREDDGKCDCDNTLTSFLKEAQITCEIQNRTGYITRSGTIWIGVVTHQNNTDVYYWHEKCPRVYCNSSKISVDLRKPDTQCNQNRGGVLCGGCPGNYSLQLGNSNCVLCDNSHMILLLLVFAVLGILLVVFISVLDLTVASGTINGLIFYANVAWRNNAILFSFQDRENIAYYIITLPIAWINLDFGIETCFSAKLDQLTKTGLQFVFPVYIWCIAGLIILICHYSTRATKLFGNNSVAVLATLFLLSYGKLFKNITNVLTYTDLRDWNNTVHSVWALDGNVSYDDPRHIGLIVVALIFFLLF